MLVISRYRNEQVILTMPDGQQIVIMVVDVRGDRIRLGIQAPQNVSVLRKEIYDKITPEQKSILCKRHREE